MSRGRRDARAGGTRRRAAAAGVALAALVALTGCGARGDAAHEVSPAAPSSTGTTASSAPAASSPATATPRQDESPSAAPAPSVDQRDVDSATAELDGAERSLDAIDQEMAQDE